MAIFNSYFDITRGYHGRLRLGSDSWRRLVACVFATLEVIPPIQIGHMAFLTYIIPP